MIQTSKRAAEDVATNMGNASDAVKQVTGINFTKAEKTTLLVNEKAQEANNKLSIVAGLISTCFNETINHIHSVANEFERTDVELDFSIGELLNHSDGIDKWRTYERAKNR